MRLNSWQWLGVALLVAGGGLYVWRQTTQHTTEGPMQMNGPTTQAIPGPPAYTPAGPGTHPTTPPATKGS
jgi:hypothetical protein